MDKMLSKEGVEQLNFKFICSALLLPITRIL